MLGVGDFYYELGIQVVETCLILQDQTGGLVDLDTIKRRIMRTRGRNAVDFSDDDIARAVATLKPLGSGYAVLQLGARKAVQSIPLEISPDHCKLLSEGQELGYVKEGDLDRLGWTRERFQRLIEAFLSDGLAWIDEQDPSAPLYWFPCFYQGFA